MLTVIPQESARRELNRAEELSAQQRSYVSFLDSPLRQTPWQFSANEHDITRASSQPLTAHPSTWVLSPEEPCSPAGWARTATSYSAGGSRHSISPKAVPGRLCSVGGGDTAHLDPRSGSWQGHHREGSEKPRWLAAPTRPPLQLQIRKPRTGGPSAREVPEQGLQTPVGFPESFWTSEKNWACVKEFMSLTTLQ